MDTIIFLTRHIPFWATPALVLCMEFGYLFWLRKKMSEFKICIGIALFSLICLSFYVYQGGPEKSVRAVIKTVKNF